MPANLADRIRGKIREYSADPSIQANNVRKLKNREGYRLRIGDWRVIFMMNGDVMKIVMIGPRGGVYRG